MATDFAMDLNPIKENDDSKMNQSEDFAGVIVNQLKLNPHVYVKTPSFNATNPF